MIYLGADHNGFKLKTKIKQFLEKHKLKYYDAGALEYNPIDDYPDFAKLVCTKLLKSKNYKKNIGILICGTGIGMSIAANRFKNIRAALCFNKKTAKQSREHNNANVLCLSQNSKFKPILKAFLNTKFTQQPRHKQRINKLNKL